MRSRTTFGRAPGAADVVGGHPPGDGQHPRADGRLGAEAGQRPERPRVGLLREVLGDPAVGEDHEHAPHLLVGQAHQLGGGAGVAVPRFAREVGERGVVEHRRRPPAPRGATCSVGLRVVVIGRQYVPGVCRRSRRSDGRRGLGLPVVAGADPVARSRARGGHCRRTRCAITPIGAGRVDSRASREGLRYDEGRGGTRAHGQGAGIWHETYLVRAGEYEAIYNNMPPSGLGRAGRLVPVGEGSTARLRIRPRRVLTSRGLRIDHALCWTASR